MSAPSIPAAAAQGSATATRPLFGGAITAELPGDLLDASDLRQVPDNQEVLLTRASDVTYILEVLQSVKEGRAASDLGEAVRFHFDSLAHDNDATGDSQVLEIFALPGVAGPTGRVDEADAATPSPLCLVGEQRVRKFGQGGGGGGGGEGGEEEADRVRIWMAVWRLSPKRDVDLVLTCNEPLSRHRQAAAGANGGGEADEPGGSEAAERSESVAKRAFMRAAASLQIRDWALFKS